MGDSMCKLALFLLLAIPGVMAAQSPDSGSCSTSSSTSATSVPQQQSSAPSSGGGSRIGRWFYQGDVHDSPVASFTASYVYDYQASQYDAHNRSLMGWSATPEVNFTKRFGLQADFMGLYMRSVYPSQTRFLAAAGPRINLAPHSRV